MMHFSKRFNLIAGAVFVLGVAGVVVFYTTTRPVPLPFVQEPGQLAYAQASGLSLEETNSVGMVMRLIPPGSYWRGSVPEEADRDIDERRHRVVIPHTIYMAATEVTQQAFETIMGFNPSATQEPGRERVPVDSMTFAQALEFCNALSEREGLDPVYEPRGQGWEAFHERNGYRLPLEAEWEYAGRATTETAFYTGSNRPRYQGRRNLWRAGWFRSNAKGRPQAVGWLEPNGWGLFDQHGNVYEYCWDWYGDYPLSTQFDLRGPRRSNMGRVMRGGCWYDQPANCRIADRHYHRPAVPLNVLGFRVVRTVIPPTDWVIDTAASGS
jgi:formylglycine-generating enzyme